MMFVIGSNTSEAHPIVALRVKEVARLGFKRAVVPAGNCPVDEAPEDLEIVGLRNISELMELIF